MRVQSLMVCRPSISFFLEEETYLLFLFLSMASLASTNHKLFCFILKFLLITTGHFLHFLFCLQPNTLYDFITSNEAAEISQCYIVLHVTM